jgi:hypothetical protein
MIKMKQVRHPRGAGGPDKWSRLKGARPTPLTRALRILAVSLELSAGFIRRFLLANVTRIVCLCSIHGDDHCYQYDYE